MAFTLSDAITEVLIQIQQPELTVSVSRPTVKLYMNEALQYVRRIAKTSDYLYFTKSHSFSGTSVNYQASFESMLFLYVPASTDGNARLASNREYNVVNANSYEVGSSANPVARLFSDHFVITPSSTGTYYYLATFGEITDETTDLETLLPWVYLELVILRTVELVMLRHFINSPQKVQQESEGLDIARKAYLALYRKWMPDIAFKEEQPSPALNIAISGQQQSDQ